MQTRRRVAVVSLLAMCLLTVLVTTSTLAQAATVTITYWQYEFKSKVEAIDELIKRFEAQNPGIKVVHQTFPYDAYQQKVAAAIASGQGPDVVNLYYGWLPLWVKTGYLAPLPEADFPAAQIEAEFVNMVQSAKVGGRYYGVPTALRSLALFYNEGLLRNAGIGAPPATWDEFIAIARKLTVEQGGRLTQIGYGIAPEGQDHHLVREVLLRQFGGRPYSEDGRRVLYGSPEGVRAFTFYTDWVTKHRIGVPRFFPGDANTSYRDGFTAGRIAMIIDGSFALASIQQGARFKWSVAELPVLEPGGKRVNFGSFWLHGITPLAKGPKLEAAVKFLKFITSEEAQRYWLDKVGELPARKALIEDPAIAQHPVYGPFLRGVPYAYATPFVDELAQRKIMVDAMNAVLLQGADPATAIRRAAEEEQAVLDQFWR